MKQLSCNILATAHSDYKESRSMARELEIEAYLDSNVFINHCKLACVDPILIRDGILASKKHHHRSSYITVYMLCLMLKYDDQKVKTWCIGNGNVSYINGWSEPRLTYWQAKRVIERFNT